MAKQVGVVGRGVIFNTRADLLFHSFCSAFYPICWPSLVTGIDSSGYSVLLDATIEALEHELHGLQKDLRRCSENRKPLGVLARNFPYRVKQAVERVVGMFFADMDDQDQTRLTEALVDRILHVFHGAHLAEARINKILDEEEMLCSINDIFLEFGLVFRPPYFKLSPEHGEQTGQVFFNPLGERTHPHWLTFHMVLDFAGEPTQQVLLRFVHFFGLRTLVLHELISHCAFQDLSDSGHNLQFVENCGYISHGWLMYYAYVFAQLLLFRETQEYARYHGRITEQLEQHLKDKVRHELARIRAGRADDAVLGFEHATRVSIAFGDVTFITEVAKHRNDLVQGYSCDMEMQETRVDLLTELIVAVVDICREDQSIDAARKILASLQNCAAFSVPRFPEGKVRSQLIDFFRYKESKILRQLM